MDLRRYIREERIRWPRVLTIGCIFAFLLCCIANVLSQGIEASNKEIRIISVKGQVELLRGGLRRAAKADTLLTPGDGLETGENSQAVLMWYGSPRQISETTKITILSPAQPTKRERLSLLKGLIYLFHRDRPGEDELQTPTAWAAIKGTEFTLRVADDGRTTLALIDGAAEMTNDFGRIPLTSGQLGIAETNKAPVVSPSRIEAVNDLIQWFLYYPAILNLDELPLEPAVTNALRESLMAYRSGALPQALAAYPAQRVPASDVEKIYLAALVLTAGQVDRAQDLLKSLALQVGPNNRLPELADALRQLIAAVKQQPFSPMNPAASRIAEPLSTSLLAASYYSQSRHDLKKPLEQALAEARRAAAKAPNFSFALARQAELEFSFGYTREASVLIEKSLNLSPQNAKAMSLRGFLLTAENKIPKALSAFQAVIAMDPSLGDAWLGRGLCRIHQGDRKGGREDLQTAAALEPQRSLLRSYLGKAYSVTGDNGRARNELRRAIEIDPKDPTPRLYAALLNQQQNRINEGIEDLEKSVEINDNRALFRSRLRLDEDLAVRSANLASLYRDAGMTDVSVREAAKAVTYDYANDSAHLFLSDSYNELRDPTRFNLRYETVWFNELLLANLLSPVGGGRLSQHLSQQEYSRLFDADGLGFANTTVGRSDKSVTELASQFGTFGRTSYSLDLDYEYHKGVRPNNDLDSKEWYTTVKQQITPQDTALLLVKYEDYHSGDNFQYFNPASARPHFRFDEYQHPIAVGAWHHEWSPGVHTLLLGGRLENEQNFKDQAATNLTLLQSNNGTIVSSDFEPFDVNYHNELEIYTAEINQIFQTERVTLSVGSRFQTGSFHAQDRFAFKGDVGLAPLFNDPAAQGAFTEGFERVTGYGYLTAQPVEHLWLIGGVAYDRITFPGNFRNPPITPGEEHRSQFGPKAGFVWAPVDQATVRGVFTRSLGGVSLDESYRLEQSQLAGFPQAFRTLIPESLVGSVSAPEYQTFGLALDLKFQSGTYAGLQAERLESNVRRSIGILSGPNGITPYVPDSTLERLDYRDNSLLVTVNQLLGKRFVLGASYKFDEVKLHDLLPNVPTIVLPSADATTHADLHHTLGYILFNDSSGFFARAETHWYHQRNSGFTPPEPGDDFFQENIFAGFRFGRRHAEVRLGILNLTGQSYHLNPLTVYEELPRKRLFEARLNFLF